MCNHVRGSCVNLKYYNRGDRITDRSKMGVKVFRFARKVVFCLETSVQTQISAVESHKRSRNVHTYTRTRVLTHITNTRVHTCERTHASSHLHLSALPIVNEQRGYCAQTTMAESKTNHPTGLSLPPARDTVSEQNRFEGHEARFKWPDPGKFFHHVLGGRNAETGREWYGPLGGCACVAVGSDRLNTIVPSISIRVDFFFFLYVSSVAREQECPTASDGTSTRAHAHVRARVLRGWRYCRNARTCPP